MPCRLLPSLLRAVMPFFLLLASLEMIAVVGQGELEAVTGRLGGQGVQECADAEDDGSSSGVRGSEDGCRRGRRGGAWLRRHRPWCRRRADRGGDQRAERYPRTRGGRRSSLRPSAGRCAGRQSASQAGATGTEAIDSNRPMTSTIQRNRAMAHVSGLAEAILSRQCRVPRLSPLVDRATHAPPGFSPVRSRAANASVRRGRGAVQ